MEHETGKIWFSYPPRKSWQYLVFGVAFLVLSPLLALAGTFLLMVTTGWAAYIPNYPVLALVLLIAFLAFLYACYRSVRLQEMLKRLQRSVERLQTAHGNLILLLIFLAGVGVFATATNLALALTLLLAGAGFLYVSYNSFRLYRSFAHRRLGLDSSGIQVMDGKRETESIAWRQVVSVSDTNMFVQLKIAGGRSFEVSRDLEDFDEFVRVVKNACLRAPLDRSQI